MKIPQKMLQGTKSHTTQNPFEGYRRNYSKAHCYRPGIWNSIWISVDCPVLIPSPPPSCKQLTLRKPESHSAVVPKKVSTWYLSSVYGTRNQQPALSSEIWCRWYTWLATIDLVLCQVLTAGHRWMKFVYFTIKHFRDLNLTFHLIIGGIGM